MVCIGPITAQTAQGLGLSVHKTAEVYTIEGLIEAIVQLVS
ncbi:uroporphyrinogen-III synthase [Candidatus Hakubella thermalkaliphila]